MFSSSTTAKSNIYSITSKEAFSELIASPEHASRAKIVDFYADWCGPCRMLTPVLEKIAKEHADRVMLIKVNTDAAPALAKEHAVFSLPTVKVLGTGTDGKVMEQFVGARDERSVMNVLRKVVSL